MKDLYYVAQQIRKGEGSEDNLTKYATGMASFYESLSLIKLSMNYYTIYDTILENNMASEVVDDLMTKLNQIIGDSVISDVNRDITAIDNLRNEVIKTMEVVTEYVDRLRIYEYVLNRIEHRFSGKELNEEYYGVYMTNDIMHYIFSDKDNVAVNARICEILGQLPVRLTKNKLYEYIRDAFSLYRGAQTGTVDDFVYTLKTSAMLHESDGFGELFPEVFSVIEELSAADYSSVGETEYKRLSKLLTQASAEIEEYADILVLIAQVINDVYTYLLVDDYSLKDIGEADTAKDIIRDVYDGFTKNILDNNSVLERFVLFEGKQEKILMSLSKCDFAVDIVAAADDIADALKEIYDRLLKTMKLQSGSDFVSLKDDSMRVQTATDEYVENASDKLIELLDKQFSMVGVAVRKAVMSSILSQLPVFFNNTDEICEYINFSLGQCADRAEKIAVVEVMKQIMQG